MRLRAAADVLGAHDASERQLRGAARRIHDNGLIFQLLFGGLVSVITAPLALMTLTNFVRLPSVYGSEFALVASQLAALLPVLAAIAVSVLFATWSFRRARRRVALATAALPPRREGESGACHVCGGGLVAGLQGVARCGFCGADNVLDAGWVAAAAASRRVELEDYAGAVRSESASVARAFGCSTLLFVGVMAIVPFTCGIPLWFTVVVAWALGGVFWILSMGNQPPTPNNRYGLVEVDGRECVAWYNPYTARWERARVRRTGRDIPVDDVREVPLDALVGRELELAFEDDGKLGQRGLAVRPRWGWYTDRKGRTVDGPDVVGLEQPGRRTPLRAPLWETCLTEPFDAP